MEAVLEAGGDVSTPPAVSPFPNWAEDSNEMVGSRVRVYWDGDNEWYSGRIVRFKATQPKPYLVRCAGVGIGVLLLFLPGRIDRAVRKGAAGIEG